MKYLRYKLLVDVNTGLPSNKQPLTHPYVTGIEPKHIPFGINPYYLSTCPNNSSIPEGCGVEEITSVEWNLHVKDIFDSLKQQYISNIYKNAKTQMAEVNKWYDPMEIAMAVSLKDQVLLAVSSDNEANANIAAPTIKNEAKIRKIKTKDLANTYFNKYTELVSLKANVSGYRGLVVDVINNTTWEQGFPVLANNLIQYDTLGWHV